MILKSWCRYRVNGAAGAAGSAISIDLYLHGGHKSWPTTGPLTGGPHVACQF